MIIFNFVAKTAIATVQNKIDISVYFKSNTAEDEILKLEKSLEGLSEVKNRICFQEQALTEFQARRKNDSIVIAAIQELGENPLLASLNIKAYNPKEYAAISTYLNNESLLL